MNRLNYAGAELRRGPTSQGPNYAGPKGRRTQRAQDPNYAGPRSQKREAYLVEQREVFNALAVWALRSLGPALFGSCVVRPLRRQPFMRRYRRMSRLPFRPLAAAR